MFTVIISTVCQENSAFRVAVSPHSHSHSILRLRSAGSTLQVVLISLHLAICYVISIYPLLPTLELLKSVPPFFLQAEIRVNFTNVRMVTSIHLSNFLTSFLSIFIFKTNIMVMIPSIIIVEIKMNSLYLIFHILPLALHYKKQSQRRLKNISVHLQKCINSFLGM